MWTLHAVVLLGSVSALVHRTPSTGAHRMSKRTVLDATKTVVVIGNGMVGQRFVELCADELAAGDDDVEIVSLCEERLAAYNRVKLTSWFETRDANKLSMVGEYEGTDGEGEFYASRKGAGKVRVRVGALATSIDTVAKEVIVGDERVPYDAAVLATGSYPFVPPINGSKLDGVFVYRTIDDLEALVAYQLKHDVKKAAVIGGGLLGLEAAKALHDLGMKTSILEYAPILMARQIDAGGHAALTSMVEELGLDVMCSARTKEFLGDENGNVRGISFDTEGWETLDCGIIVVSAGIRPRDEVARKSEGVTVHERGGVLVDDQLRTTAENVFAIGEVALHRGMIYGLVAPGYDMAKMAAQNVVDALRGVEPSQTFEGADLSTKLKLLGCDVASFGDASVTDATSALVWDDTVNRIYRKLVFSKEPGARKLLGGILVGDAGDYSDLLKLYKDGDDCSATASSLLAPPSAAKPGAVSGEVDEATLLKKQICSCNDVAVGAIVDAIAADPAISLAALKKLTTAGTGCGGCEPDVKKILAAELTKLGMVVDNRLCEHFSHSRPELVALVKTGDQRSFPEVIAAHGSGHDGCEVCKPAVASILASLYNEAVLGDDRASLQDTNDRSLANMQRGGSYSVVPRIPAGEITPAALMAIAEVAADYKLYTKVTGAQRIDLFGAAKADLPSIWAKLGEAGLESGHAYGKSLRTVKSCVGSSWCRYGVQNSVDFAVTVETRYKGLRSPHKLKSGVSGCTRECAEAASKDFGMIATELGYDIYVCGNGGASPRLGVQLAVGVDEATTLKLLDRFLMYYILTAERLERTARWFERLGPNDETRTAALKAVVIDDSLGLNAEFEQRMDDIVASYSDEWADVVSDPERAAKFKQFVNTDETQGAEDMIEFMDVRGQRRPVDWQPDGSPQTMWRPPAHAEQGGVFARSEKTWVDFGPAADFPAEMGSAVLYGETQLAIFNLAQRGQWFATQNMCPHKQAFVLAQGLVGAKGGVPMVACPLHKKNFALESGDEIGGGDLNIVTFPVQIVDGIVQVELPNRDEVDAVLATPKLRVNAECQNAVLA